MRTIEWTTQLKRDYRRESKGAYRNTLDLELFSVIEALASDRALEARFRDHALVGEWKDCRDCHIKPDLVLIYMRSGLDALRLIRLGSHSELGL
jgi:mRNA interferase YafQ